MSVRLSTSRFALFLVIWLWSCAPAFVPSHQFAYPELSLQLQSAQGKSPNQVIFDARHQQYISGWVGSREFALEVFSAQGEPIAQTPAEIDLRGIWLGFRSKKLMTNAYLGGIEARKMDESGIPNGEHQIINHRHEPPSNDAVATLDTDRRKLMYLMAPGVWLYTPKGKAIKPIRFKGLPVSWDYLNPTQAIYTGWKGKEIGVLDVKNKKVYLFDKQTGVFAASISLHPKTHVPERFGFAFANGLLWLYDAPKRRWVGYRPKVTPFGKE